MSDLDRAYEGLFRWMLNNTPGGWPRPKDIIRFARKYGVPAAILGREFGWFSYRRDRSVLWVDAQRDAQAVGAGLPDELRPAALAWRKL